MSASRVRRVLTGVSGPDLATLPLFALAAVLLARLTLTERVGSDFKVFYAAGYVISRSGNPYNYALMHAAPSAPLFGSVGSHLLFPYLPFMAWLFSPLTQLPDGLAFAVWDLVLFALVSGSIYCWARSCGMKYSALAALVAAVSITAVYNYNLGQTSILVLVGLVGVLISAQKHCLGWAGAFAAMAALIKPQDAWLLVPLVWVLASNWRELRRIIAVQIGATVALFGAPLLTNPALLGEWVRFMIEFAKAPNAGSTAGIGIASSMVGWLPQTQHLASTLPLVGVALAIVVALVLRQSQAISRLPWPRRVGWIIMLPLTAWLLLTPYANAQDLIIVAPLVVLVLTSGPKTLRSPVAGVLLGAVLLIPPLQQLGVVYLDHPWDIEVLALIAVLVVSVVVLRREAIPFTSRDDHQLSSGPSVRPHYLSSDLQ